MDYSAQVWVNGHLVAEHRGGHTPFSADITDVLVNSGKQILVVRAVDDPHDLEQPRGKQDWQDKPHAIWYQRTSGSWKSVWLEPVPALRIEHLRWTPDLEAAVLTLDVRLNRVPDKGLWLRLLLTHEDGDIRADTVVSMNRDRATVSVRL